MYVGVIDVQKASDAEEIGRTSAGTAPYNSIAYQ
jgi:hypothetical protein